MTEIYSKIFFNIVGRYDSSKQLTVIKIGQRLRRFKESLIDLTQNKLNQIMMEDLIGWIDRKKEGGIKQCR